MMLAGKKRIELSLDEAQVKIISALVESGPLNRFVWVMATGRFRN